MLLLPLPVAPPTKLQALPVPHFPCAGVGSGSVYPCIRMPRSNSLIFLKLAPNQDPRPLFLHQLPSVPRPPPAFDFTAGRYGNGLMSWGTGSSGREKPAATRRNHEPARVRTGFVPLPRNQRELFNIQCQILIFNSEKK